MTELAKILRNRSAFPWGHIRKFHDVGERYTIIEHDDKHGDVDGVGFHPFVDGQDTCETFHSLDRAVISAIAHGNIAEVNTASAMARAAAKLVLEP